MCIVCVCMCIMCACRYVHRGCVYCALCVVLHVCLCVHVCVVCVVWCVSPFPCWFGPEEKGACYLTSYLCDAANSTP